ncbi:MULTISPECIES: polyphenol oxidase family protein [unclassified Tatumella]|uniref:polyphenol oxidase family protein n=1 Tax=unclassified Tatumella TaxID=2649542 RepID=UPI001BAF0D7C|nr:MULTISPECIES: polyphenol oxidase family protein [unclassified Tatumella]MBS0855225.1 polyphenol oxidase family protein [Tatumella sp. JGM16]MBS0876777.1 polyphenol oxidase family protein [Tatumella sp. JGM82]MBS0889798.1 polyphenol oxidase family protein [Tatumella sp. JGM94]MBS0901532.1 polyphenol oxidase family protein [Tatumella sp. JGM100]MBS0911782.1 polyphenol oxidase family protein [Tatumella sp. JGM91]
MSRSAAAVTRSPLLDSLGWVSHQFLPAGIRPPADAAYGIQRHSATVLCAEDNFPPQQVVSDGLISRGRQPAAVYTADCLPVLIASPQTRQVAAVHAGLKGTLAGILQQAVRRLCDKGASSSSLYIAIGPAIGPCCYQLGRPVLTEIEQCCGFSGPCYDYPGDNPRAVRPCAPQSYPAVWLDLPALASQILACEGVPPEQIDNLHCCTYCMAEDGASFRRNTHTGEGYQLRFSWIANNTAPQAAETQGQ